MAAGITANQQAFGVLTVKPKIGNAI